MIAQMMNITYVKKMIVLEDKFDWVSISIRKLDPRAELN